MPPRRPRATSNASYDHTKKGPRRPDSAAGAPAPAQTPSAAAMSHASRFALNLNVVRRRDPSIVRIFDQFNHVTVYHHNYEAGKWEKHGYEGAMFLFERDGEHRYGFYILNRGGKQDFVQTMYPWDDMKRQLQYHMYKTYPDYSELMLSGNPPPPPPRVEGQDYDQYAARRDTRPVMLGFWTFDPADGEQLTETLNRLHACIKSGEPYPEEFKYDTGRLPPGKSPNSASATSEPDGTPAIARNGTPSAGTHQGMAAIDQLFANAAAARATPAPGSAAASPALRQHRAAPSASALPPVAHTPIDHLFAGLAGARQVPPPAAYAPVDAAGTAGGALGVMPDALMRGLELGQPRHEVPAYGLPPQAHPSYGLPPTLPTTPAAGFIPMQPLGYGPTHVPSQGEMNSAFRFPRPAGSGYPVHPAPPPTGQPAPVILSPKPKASGLPPLLSEMFTSAGPGPSTGSSGASGGSRASSAAGASNGLPAVGGFAGATAANGLGPAMGTGEALGLQPPALASPAAGDLTPRAAPVMLPALASLFASVRGQASVPAVAAPSALAPPAADMATPPAAGGAAPTIPSALAAMFAAASADTPVPPSVGLSLAATAPPPPADSAPTNGATSVDGTSVRPSHVRAESAFSDTSALWASDTSGSVDGGDILELDFGDTHALADPSAFRAAVRAARGPAKGLAKPAPAGKAQTPAQAKPPTSPTKRPVSVSPAKQARGPVPTGPRTQAQGLVPSGPQAQAQAPVLVPASAQPERARPSPAPAAEAPKSAPLPTSALSPQLMPSQVRKPQKVNGTGVNGAHPESPLLGLGAQASPLLARGTPHPYVNGHTALPSMDRAALGGSLLDMLLPHHAHAAVPAGLGRTEFVREVFALLQTDGAFVDTLWREYQARAA